MTAQLLSDRGKRSCGCTIPEAFSLIGQRFGRLTVVECCGMGTVGSAKIKRRLWKCLCDCGNYHITNSDKLREYARSCGCWAKEELSLRQRKEYGEALKNRVISYYKNNSKKKKMEFELTDEEMEELFQDNCYYCGIKPSKTVSNKKNYGTYTYNGIDRLYSNIGYKKDNVVSCCFTCNRFKTDIHVDTFLSLIKKIAINRKLIDKI